MSDKVLGIFQIWLPTLLELFLTVQMREKEESFTQESSPKFECDTRRN